MIEIIDRKFLEQVPEDRTVATRVEQVSGVRTVLKIVPVLPPGDR